MGQAAWVDVANVAIMKVGTQLIQTLSATSVQAKLCALRLPLTVPIILRSYPWKSAMKVQQLSALSTQPIDPNYRFAYQLPVDICRVWRLNFIPIGHTFVIRQGQMWANTGVTIDEQSDGSTIQTGEAPLLTYVANPNLTPTSPGPGPLDALLLEAISCQLAVDICYQLTQSLPLKQSLQAEAKVALQRAKSVDSMETPEVFDFEASEFLSARFAGTGYAGPILPGMAPGQ